MSMQDLARTAIHAARNFLLRPRRAAEPSAGPLGIGGGGGLSVLYAVLRGETVSDEEIERQAITMLFMGFKPDEINRKLYGDRAVRDDDELAERVEVELPTSWLDMPERGQARTPGGLDCMSEEDRRDYEGGADFSELSGPEAPK